MAEVWAARHLVTKRRVAIKVLKGPTHPELVQRFLREARAANAVKHPNVVQVHDVFELQAGVPAMVMDLFEGETLDGFIGRRGTLSLAELGRVVAPIASALLAIHAAGIVHRDLKPQNVFLANLEDGRVEPMILDFGICKLDASLDSLAQSDVSTTAGRMMGTPSYMAPEQVRGAVDVDARADVWALGVILYECVSGKLPWPSESMARIVSGITSGPLLRVENAAPQLPPELVHVINGMLVRDPAARLADLRDVVAVLERLSGAVADTVLVPSSPVAVSSAAPRRPQQEDTLIRPRLERGTDGALRMPRRRAPFFGIALGVVLAGLSGAGALLLVTRLLAPAPVAPVAQAQAASALPNVAFADSVPRAEAADALTLSQVRADETPAAVESPAAPAAASAEPRSKKPRQRSPAGWRDYGGRR
jgi:serine/threonine-protein kinase